MNKGREVASYAQKAQQMMNGAIANFDRIKLDKEETVQAVVCSDVACVTLSEKRAYFGGNYFGLEKNAGRGDVIPMHGIRDVYLKNIYSKSAGIKMRKYLIYLIMILCVNFMVHNWYGNAVEEMNKATANTESLKNNSNYYYDSNFYDYYLTNNDNFRRINPYSESEIQARGYDMDRIENAERVQAEMEEQFVVKTQTRWTVIVFSVIFGFFIVVKLITLWNTSKIQVLEFDCWNKRLGVELKDVSSFGMIRNMVLSARNRNFT